MKAREFDKAFDDGDAVDAVLDYVREKSESELLVIGGLREVEDVFASVWESVKNRWSWLAINLITAFIASRVIGAFEGSIEKLVALAALMRARDVDHLLVVTDHRSGNAPQWVTGWPGIPDAGAWIAVSTRSG